MADIAEYVGALSSGERLLEMPPHPSLPEAERESWALADTLEYAGLECWAWGLEAWGRRTVVRAACSVAEVALAALERASEAPSGDLLVYLDNTANGLPSAASQVAAARAWLANPSATSLAAVVATFDVEGLLEPDVLEQSEFDSLRREAWAWACISALGTAALVENPAMHHWLSRTFVSAARGLAAEGREPETACLLVWKAVQTAFESPA